MLSLYCEFFNAGSNNFITSTITTHGESLKDVTDTLCRLLKNYNSKPKSTFITKSWAVLNKNSIIVFEKNFIEIVDGKVVVKAS